MAAPIGTTVTLTYDLVHNTDWPDPGEGDWLVGYNERLDRWGSAYFILSARQVRSTIAPRRFSLRCLKLGPSGVAEIKDGERVFPIVWSRRDRRRPR